MSSAERVIAFNELLTATGHDPHAVPADVKRVVHDAALKYARTSGYRPPGDAPAAQRVAAGARSAVAGDGPLVRFGRDKGKQLSRVTDLTWYRRAVAENVADPTKARFHEQNVAHLAEIEEAMSAQEHPDPDDADPMGPF